LADSYINSLGKKNEVRAMFNSIARNYDLLNHLLSFGIDIVWRKRLIKELIKSSPNHVIDIATGTADLAIMAVKRKVPNVTGVDLSENMISIGNMKLEKHLLKERILLKRGDAEALPFDDNSFDAGMVSFGIRNFENLDKGLTDIYRVLKSGSKFFILEFSQPDNVLFRKLYKFYLQYVLPLIGKIISKNSSAYNYLPESIGKFPYGREMIKILEKNGYYNCQFIPLTFQIATIYIGTKR
jgi:demethylmenaquinone methyltransferase / 2-methoxy-6-polyprenyl-1,4-benzoquinol methylase